MNKIEMIKKIGIIVVSVGVGAIVSNTIKSTTPSSIGTIKKFCIGVGGFVLSSMISDKASRYAEQQIDHTVMEIKKMVNNNEI
jgi:hypothetical protein